ALWHSAAPVAKCNGLGLSIARRPLTLISHLLSAQAIASDAPEHKDALARRLPVGAEANRPPSNAPDIAVTEEFGHARTLRAGVGVGRPSPARRASALEPGAGTRPGTGAVRTPGDQRLHGTCREPGRGRG